MVIPPLVIALIWRSFFFEATNGYLNRFIAAAHLYPVLNWLAPVMGWGDAFAGVSKPAWLGDPRLLMTSVIIWGFPWISSLAILTHLAQLQGISKDVYEAAQIDGANWWTKFTRIELPLITGSIYFMLVLTIISTIMDAGMIIALAGFEGGPGGKVDVPAVFMLRKAFIDQKIGYACAVGLMLTVIVMSLEKLSTLLRNWENRKPWQRTGLRTGSLLLGGWMLYSRFMAPVALLLVLLGLRWSRIRSVLDLIPRHGPARRRDNKFFAWFLRVQKHATILGVLGLSLLPLYLMLIVSMKTNTQFYSHPTTITAPIHWENWQAAWNSITPTLANSVCISFFSTLLMITMALTGAYFFARLRMSLSRVLWNAILILMMMPMIANMVPLFRLLKDLH